MFSFKQDCNDFVNPLNLLKEVLLLFELKERILYLLL